jgi:hypothetical protein
VIRATSPGICAPAPRRRERRRRATIRFNGGCTFAERPDLAAPEARIIWHADLDPGTLHVVALPIEPGDPDEVNPQRLRPWLAVATDSDGHEHAVLSDGWHHIRLDIEAGSLAAGRPVLFQYRLVGVASAGPKVLPLRRLLDLCRRGRFAPSLFPPDRRVDRWIALLQVHDALRDGASQREIAGVLFGEERTLADWRGSSDSLRSRLRRLVREARAMAGGGYRSLLRGTSAGVPSDR